jgi:hypothetical protein
LLPLPLFLLLHLSHPFFPFLTALPGTISPSLDFYPILAFKFWWAFPSIWVSLSLPVLLWTMVKPWLGERLPPSTSWMDLPAIFWEHLKKSKCTHLW